MLRMSHIPGGWQQRLWAESWQISIPYDPRYEGPEHGLAAELRHPAHLRQNPPPAFHLKAHAAPSALCHTNPDGKNKTRKSVTSCLCKENHQLNAY